jgi:hypothetical protein
MMIQETVALLQSFLNQHVTAADFAKHYIELFRSHQKEPSKEFKEIEKDYLTGKMTREDFLTRVRLANPGMMDERLFAILEDLYEDVDAYSPSLVPDEESPYIITEETLRQEATEGLVRLNSYISQQTGTQ